MGAPPPRTFADDEALLNATAKRAIRYLKSLDTRRVGPTNSAIERIDRLGGTLPLAGCDADRVIALLDEIGSEAATACAGGRYFGFVIGGALPVTVAANWLAAAWDQNAATSGTSPFGARIEEIVLPWVIELLGLPAASAGALVTGASVATLTALAAARYHLFARRNWDVHAQGLGGAPPLRIVVSDEVHVTVLKAISLLGFGSNAIVRVRTDGEGRMKLEELPSLDDSTIVCVQAGNVNTGSFDPIREICSRAQAAGAWVHVDGAFGLWAAPSDKLRRLTAGISEADSWSTDAHKWLNVPQDCGIALVRHAASLRSAMAVSAPYLVAGGRRDPADYGPELSRRARGIEVWAAIQHLGRDGIVSLVDRCCEHAKWLADHLRGAGYEIRNKVVLNQVLVSLGDERFTKRVIARIQADGEIWCGGTVWQGRAAMRVSVSGWATTQADMQRSVAAIISATEACRNEPA